MKPKTCDQCKKVFSTNFCPECGRKYEDVVINLPVTITTYVHGSKEEGCQLCEKYNIDPKSELGKKLIYINYEIKLVYAIEGNEIYLKRVDAGDGQKLCDVIPKIKEN